MEVFHMTAQLPTIITFKGNEYNLLGYDDAIFKVDPNDYGIKPVVKSSACWSGYRCEYELRDDVLYLSYLHVSYGTHVEEYDEEAKEIKCRYRNSHPEEMPPIMGVKAEYGRGYRFNIMYNLNLNTNYNGRLLFSREYKSKYRTQEGKQKTYSIKEVLSAEFLEGKMVSITDFTEDAWYAKIAIDARNKATTNPVARMMQKPMYDTFDTDYNDRIEYLKAWTKKGKAYVVENSIEIPPYISIIVPSKE